MACSATDFFYFKYHLSKSAKSNIGSLYYSSRVLKFPTVMQYIAKPVSILPNRKQLFERSKKPRNMLSAILVRDFFFHCRASFTKQNKSYQKKKSWKESRVTLELFKKKNNFNKIYSSTHMIRYHMIIESEPDYGSCRPLLIGENEVTRGCANFVWLYEY